MRKIEGAKMDINMLLVWEKYAEVHAHTHTHTRARAHTMMSIGYFWPVYRSNWLRRLPPEDETGWLGRLDWEED